MTLCWNPDGSMCDDKELAHRIKECMAGRYKPWVKEAYDKMIRQQHAKDSAAAQKSRKQYEESDGSLSFYQWLQRRP